MCPVVQPRTRYLSVVNHSLTTVSAERGRAESGKPSRWQPGLVVRRRWRSAVTCSPPVPVLRRWSTKRSRVACSATAFSDLRLVFSRPPRAVPTVIVARSVHDITDRLRFGKRSRRPIQPPIAKARTTESVPRDDATPETPTDATAAAPAAATTTASLNRTEGVLVLFLFSFVRYVTR